MAVLTDKNDDRVRAVMFDLRKPFCADVFKRRRTDDTEADEKYVRLQLRHGTQYHCNAGHYEKYVRLQLRHTGYSYVSSHSITVTPAGH